VSLKAFLSFNVNSVNYGINKDKSCCNLRDMGCVESILNICVYMQAEKQVSFCGIGYFLLKSKLIEYLQILIGYCSNS